MNNNNSERFAALFAIIIFFFLTFLALAYQSKLEDKITILENKPEQVIECVFDKGGSAIYNIGKIKFDDGYAQFYPKTGDVISSGFRIGDLNDMECVIK